MASDTEDTETCKRLEMDCDPTSGMTWAKPPSVNRVSQGRRRAERGPPRRHACRRQWATYASVDSPYPTTL